MSEPETPSALREWRNHFGQTETLVILFSVSGILGLAGPFGTVSLLNLVERLAYWGAITFVGYGWGSCISIYMRRSFSGRAMAVYVLGSSVLTTFGISALVMGLNALTFAALPDEYALTQLLPFFFAICLIVTASVTYLRRQKSAVIEEVAKRDVVPPLMDRLPVEKRGALVALCVEDHYVRVRTLSGEALILMRLSDAIREVGNTAGDQVHRSYWAAFDQVQSVRRQGDRVILTMKTGDEVPVSRANLPKIKEAGLWPR